MSEKSGEKAAKTQEKVTWQMSPRGGSGLRFSLKAVKSKVETNLTCNQCGHDYAHRSLLKRHKKRSICSAGPQSSCNLCGKVFKVKYSLGRHLKNGKCNLEKKVEITAQEHNGSFLKFLDKEDETAKDKEVEESKESEDTKNSAIMYEKHEMDIHSCFVEK